MPPLQPVSTDPVPPVAEGTLGEDHGDPGTGSQAPWTYSVSVRSLCEFTAKAGDLDRRFTPSATPRFSAVSCWRPLKTEPPFRVVGVKPSGWPGATQIWFCANNLLELGLPPVR